MRDHDGSLSELSSARYARLATFTKDGRRKETGGLVEDGTSELTGTARVVTGREYAPVEAALLAKYGLQFRLFRGFAKIARRLGRREDLCGIVISPG